MNSMNVTRLGSIKDHTEFKYQIRLRNLDINIIFNPISFILSNDMKLLALIMSVMD